MDCPVETIATSTPPPSVGGGRCRCQGGRGSDHGRSTAACSDAPRPSLAAAEVVFFAALQDMAEFLETFSALGPNLSHLSMMKLHFALERVQSAIARTRREVLPHCQNDFPAVVRGELTAAALRTDHP